MHALSLCLSVTLCRRITSLNMAYARLLPCAEGTQILTCFFINRKLCVETPVHVSTPIVMRTLLGTFGPWAVDSSLPVSEGTAEGSRAAARLTEETSLALIHTSQHDDITYRHSVSHNVWFPTDTLTSKSPELEHAHTHPHSCTHKHTQSDGKEVLGYDAVRTIRICWDSTSHSGAHYKHTHTHTQDTLHTTHFHTHQDQSTHTHRTTVRHPDAHVWTYHSVAHTHCPEGLDVKLQHYMHYTHVLTFTLQSTSTHTHTSTHSSTVSVFRDVVTDCSHTEHRTLPGLQHSTVHLHHQWS